MMKRFAFGSGRILAGVVKDQLALTALLVLLLLLLGAVLAPLLPVGRPDEIGFGPRLSSPALAYPFGTDQLGRSVLARILQGIQSTTLLSTAAVLISGIASALVAMMAAYHSSTADEVSSRFSDIMFSFPPILLGILVVAVIGPGIFSVMAVIALVTFPTMLRVVRAATLSVMKHDFVIVAEISGVSFLQRVMTHILPSVSSAIAVQLIYSISFGMILESAMSFLGIGVQPPIASLGTLIRDGMAYLEVAPWLTFSAGVVLSLAILSINLIGDGLKRMVDPLERT